MNCLECGDVFVPTKYKPNQKYCSSSCRTQARVRYKRAYDRRWRRAHPGYMKKYLREYHTI